MDSLLGYLGLFSVCVCVCVRQPFSFMIMILSQFKCCYVQFTGLP